MIPKAATSKQIGFIQWKIRIEKPELEGLEGFKHLNKMSVFEASDLIGEIKDGFWEQAELIIKNLHPDK